MTLPENRILIDGKPYPNAPDAAAGATTDTCLHGNYVYAAVNTVDHHPLYLGKHLGYAAASYRKLYGTAPDFDIRTIRNEIEQLLDMNRMPNTGNIVHVYFLPLQPENPSASPYSRIVTCERTTIYRGYDLSSIRPRVILTNYEIPFSGHRTAVSLTTSKYMQAFAVRSGNHAAIRVNRNEKVISCGEYPIFFVKGGTVYMPPAPDESPLCTERELMLRLCELAGVPTAERSISAEEIAGSDEIIIFDSAGLQSVLCWGSHYFYNMIANRLATQIPQLNTEGLR